VYSHQLAKAAGVTPAQVRRDMMDIGYNGSPIHGYNVTELIKSIDDFLDAPEGQRAMLVGIGNLGRALISYFAGRRPQLTLVAAFDRDPRKVNRVIHGTRCYPDKRIAKVVKAKGISIAIIAVPASEAQAVAKKCVKAGIKGILNFAPVPLHVPEHIYVLDTDISMALEKVAFFARNKRRRSGV